MQNPHKEITVELCLPVMAGYRNATGFIWQIQCRGQIEGHAYEQAPVLIVHLAVQLASGAWPSRDPGSICEASAVCGNSLDATGPDPGQATTPDGGRAVLVVGSARQLTPLAPDMQKLLQVDRLIENSPTRVFYLMKPQGETLQYIVDQQFKAGRCRFQLTVPKGYADAEVMKIVATLRSTR